MRHPRRSRLDGRLLAGLLVLSACANPFRGEEEATTTDTTAIDGAEDEAADPPRIEDPTIEVVSWCVECTQDDIEAGTARPDVVGVTVKGRVNAPPEIGDLNLFVAPQDGEGWSFPIELDEANDFNLTETIAIDGERVRTSAELRVLILELALDTTGGAKVVYALPTFTASDPPALPTPPGDSDEGGGGSELPDLACVSVSNPEPVEVPEIDDDLSHDAGTVVVSDEVIGIFPGC